MSRFSTPLICIAQRPDRPHATHAAPLLEVASMMPVSQEPETTSLGNGVRDVDRDVNWESETPVTCDTSRRWWRATRREAMRWSHYTFSAGEGKIPVLRADRRQENLATGTWMAHRRVWQLLTNSTAIAKMRALCSVSPA